MLLTGRVRLFLFLMCSQLIFNAKANFCEGYFAASPITKSWINLFKEHQSLLSFTPHIQKQAFETTIYFPTHSDSLKAFPEIPLESQAIVIALTGSGGENVSGKNFMRNAKKLQRYGVALVSFDYPFHARGPRDPKFNDLAEFQKMVLNIIGHFKKTGKPIILQGHSFGALLAQDILHISPDLVDGVVITSPGGNVTPGLLAQYLHEFPPGQAAEVMKGFKWKFNAEADAWAEGSDGISGIAGQMESNKADMRIKSQTPIHILAGDQDPYSTPALIEEFSLRFANPKVEVFPGFGHVTINDVPGKREEGPYDAILEMIEAKTGQPLVSADAQRTSYQEQFAYFLNQSEAFRRYLLEVENISLAKASKLLANRNQFAIEALIVRWNQFFLKELWSFLKSGPSVAEKLIADNPKLANYLQAPSYEALSAKQTEGFTALSLTLSLRNVE